MKELPSGGFYLHKYNENVTQFFVKTQSKIKIILQNYFQPHCACHVEANCQ